ncbi:cytochrome c oxidase assembly protein [Alphaproteobacteria bacterium]|nr:cytochrome c oxidase assembly protein [Alphaproteobacteria bacterium]
MKNKKNRFVIFYIFNIILLFVVLLLAVPISKLLKRISLDDNDFVTEQQIINPTKDAPKVINRIMNIKFVAEVDDNLRWEFIAIQDEVSINVGKTQIISFEGKNLSNRIVTSTADFIAYPENIFPYLVKTECFCFTQQTLKPMESKIFTMVFYLDPSLDFDSNLDNLKELVFTYKFSEYKS